MRQGLGPAAGLCLALASCGSGSPAETPASWFHDLQGGAIAAQRPPPPGIGLPYPRIASVPGKPVLPDPAYRRALQEQLIAQRERTQRIAADTPIAYANPPPPKAGPAPAQPGTENVEPAATASLATAEAPPASAGAQLSPPTAQESAEPSPIPPGTPVTLAGAGPDTSSLPPIPAAPPAPATFEGIAPEPLPTPPPPVPTGIPFSQRGTEILFPTGQATLLASQNETLKQVAGRRGHQSVEITGAGEAASDSPEGQQAAIDLALRRAEAVAAGLQAQHVPQQSIHLAAYAFGRGATIRLIP